MAGQTNVLHESLRSQLTDHFPLLCAIPIENEEFVLHSVAELEKENLREKRTPNLNQVQIRTK